MTSTKNSQGLPMAMRKDCLLPVRSCGIDSSPPPGGGCETAWGTWGSRDRLVRVLWSLLLLLSPPAAAPQRPLRWLAPSESLLLPPPWSLVVVPPPPLPPKTKCHALAA